MSLPYCILLYYHFVEIEEPELFADGHLAFCAWLGLKGRIIVAKEGINGTVSGLRTQSDEYMRVMSSDPRFRDMEFKVDEHAEHAFPRLSVKAREEIVTFGKPLAASARRGTYVGPTGFRSLLDDPDTLILDGRNDFEYELGHFRGAIRPGFETFKDAPRWLAENLIGKKQPIATYCTGGIRCEKLSAFLIELGYENVMQLRGGIVEYGKDPEVQGELFEGQCFVFDERIAIPINRTSSATVIARCLHCGEPSEAYVNCANTLCNRLYFCCATCEAATDRCCSTCCEQAPAKRAKGGRLQPAT